MRVRTAGQRTGAAGNDGRATSRLSLGWRCSYERARPSGGVKVLSASIRRPLTLTRPMHTRALVLFSGGQDSTTCLAWALARYAHVETIGFDYGQRHAVELEVRLDVLARLRAAFPHWAARLGDDRVVTMRELAQLSDTALTQAA